MADLTKPVRADLAPLVARARDLRDASTVAPRTREAYAEDWKLFVRWCWEKGLATRPADENVLQVYLSYLDQEHLALATMERAYAGIIHTWREGGSEFYPSSALRRYWKNLRRERAGERKGKRDAITKAMLVRMVAVAGVRDRAILLIGWTGALRRSEIVALDTADLNFVPEGVVVTVRKSKTDQEGKGREIGIPLAGERALCATQALRTWLGGRTDGPLFCIGNGDRLGERSVALIVKRVAKRAGYDATNLSGHSLRAGFMTEGAAQGRPLEVLMKQSGHKSERIAAGYVRHASLFVNNPAKGLL